MKSCKRRRNGTVETEMPLKDNDLAENKWIHNQNLFPPQLPTNYQQQMLNDSSNFYRSDVSEPLSIKPASMNSYYNAENSIINNKSGHHYQLLMKPPQMPFSMQQPYPISYGISAANEHSKLHEIDNLLKGGSNPYNLHAAQSYLSQLAHQQHQSFLNPEYGSSCYTLTPASSTTSLHDFALTNATNLHQNLTNQPQQQALKRSNLTRTDSKKRARTATCENTGEDSTTANLKKANAAKADAAATTATNAAPKRRGRPPKNQVTIEGAATSTTTTTSTTQIKLTQLNEVKASGGSSLCRSNSSIDSSTTSKFPKSNKLIKSLINKSSSNSNLQKSKVQTAETLKPAPVDIENSKPQTADHANTAGKQILANQTNNQQAQITGYLVDKVNTSANETLVQQQIHTKTGINVQEYSALKVAGVTVVKTSNGQQQLNSTNQTIYTGYYNKVKSIRSSSTTDLNITTEEYTTVTEKQAREDAPTSLEPTTPMPKLSWANNHELWQKMLRKDAKYIHDPFYLKRHANIEPQMRAILLDWLVEICYAYRLHRETWHLALEYMDRFMTCCKQQMRVDRLQLIGMTCLFLAAKVEEIYPPKLKELASHMENYSNNNEDAISQFELFILKTLNWEISPVTANTWLMTYMQIASINYYSLMSNTAPSDQPLSSHMVMPLNIYKNSNATKLNATVQQQQFYIKNYMKSVTLLDLCMFEMDSLKFSYSVLAASAMFHMIVYNPAATMNQDNMYATPLNQSGGAAQLATKVVELSTGYKMYELDACVKWMYPFADVCKDILTEEKMTFVKTFSSVEQEDSHNIQLYHQNLELLKEAQSRKTPCKFYSNPNQPAPITLTPPDSHRKFANSSVSGLAGDNNSTLIYKN